MRVRCKVTGELGTVVGEYGRGRYEVAWDRPTPWQAAATAKIIPGPFFEWA